MDWGWIWSWKRARRKVWNFQWKYQGAPNSDHHSKFGRFPATWWRVWRVRVLAVHWQFTAFQPVVGGTQLSILIHWLRKQTSKVDPFHNFTWFQPKLFKTSNETTRVRPKKYKKEFLGLHREPPVLQPANALSFITGHFVTETYFCDDILTHKFSRQKLLRLIVCCKKKTNSENLEKLRQNWLIISFDRHWEVITEVRKQLHCPLAWICEESLDLIILCFGCNCEQSFFLCTVLYIYIIKKYISI